MTQIQKKINQTKYNFKEKCTNCLMKLFSSQNSNNCCCDFFTESQYSNLEYQPYSCKCCGYKLTKKGYVFVKVIQIVIILILVSISSLAFVKYDNSETDSYSCKYTGLSPQNNTLFGYEYDCLIDINTHLIERKISLNVPEISPGNVIKMYSDCKNPEYIENQHKYCEEWYLGIAIPSLVISILLFVYLLTSFIMNLFCC